MVSATKAEFRPFLVEGGPNRSNIFRVMEVSNPELQKEDIEKLLSQFPVTFRLQRGISVHEEQLHEPLEVYIAGAIIYVYPPRHRVIACTTLGSWDPGSLASRLHIDNLVDTSHPGGGQIRTCIHFDPKMFGIKDWPYAGDMELELDSFVFPKDTEREQKLAPISFGKSGVRKLLELIAGGDKELTLAQLQEWRELIMYAVSSMRLCYERPDLPEDDSSRRYYASCWKNIEEAKGNDERMIQALGSLRSSIQWD